MGASFRVAAAMPEGRYTGIVGKKPAMASADDRDDEPTPDRAIRRFDVFAEYTRQERLEKGYPEDEAKGYGVWLAKVVAARRFGAGSATSDRAKPSTRRGEPAEEPKFRSVGEELQTDETFDHDIIDRMGPKFYEDVFVPAIAEARERGESYESIRDEIRKSWKPVRSRSR
jgi:hypothetical protein